MPLELRPSSAFPHRRPVLVVIADGVGEAPPGPMNAVTEAATPTMDRLADTRLYRTLKAHGPAVGLPSDDDMGNSEVGHNALGAGRVFAQGAKLVGHAIESGEIFEIRRVAGRDRTFSIRHAPPARSSLRRQRPQSQRPPVCADAPSRRREVSSGVRVHILHDGRDVDPRSALTYIDATEAVIAELNSSGADVAIASGGGRMTITMDRYGADWAMVERGYWCHTHGEGRPLHVGDEAAVETMYAETDNGDQYLDRFVVVDRRR